MCQIAEVAAHRPKATKGRRRNASTARTSRLRAIGPRMNGGRKKTSSGPRSATIINAIPRSPISMCWSMCTDSRWFSPIVWIGETSPATTTPRPVAKRASRRQSARSRRFRARRRNQPWRKSPAASAAGTSTEGGADQAACATGTPLRLEAEEPGDDHALHLVRALADLEDLLVAVEPRDREFLREAVAAVDLQRRVDDAVREDAGIELRLRCGEAEV